MKPDLEKLIQFAVVVAAFDDIATRCSNDKLSEAIAFRAWIGWSGRKVLAPA
jgi:hypothetical protein